MSPPSVSVVIPAYNSAWSISDTIRSVLAQSHEDFELLVVNDGSTDNLSDVIAPFIAADKRVRMIVQPNAGLAAARNRGMAESLGEFIGFLDADDVWHPDFVALLLAAVKLQPRAPFAYAYSLRIDERNRILSIPHWARAPRHDFAGLLSLNSVGNGSAALFRAAAIRKAGGFDVSLGARNLQGAEDWKLCLQLAAGHAPVLVPRHLIGYRLVESSMSQNDPARQLRAIHAVMADIRAEFPATPARVFRDARTMMNGWLLEAFVRRGDPAKVLWLLIESYLLNPLWFRSPDLRALHLQKILSIARAGLAPQQSLADLVEDGTRPYAFLQSHPPGSLQADYSVAMTGAA